MRRDIIVSVFLFFVLFALIFVVLFPIYYTYGQVFYRSVSVAERIMSVLFVLSWAALCTYTAYFKKLTCLFGGILYSLLAYLPGIVIPKLTTAVPGSDPNLMTSLLDGAMRRLYELINAPMTGVSVLFPPEKAIGISKWMLPVLVASYILTQIFRFYRNAYLADQLLLTDAPSGSTSGLPAGSPSGEAVQSGSKTVGSSSPRFKERAASLIAGLKTLRKRTSADIAANGQEAAATDDFREAQTEKADDIPEIGAAEDDFREDGGELVSAGESEAERVEPVDDFASESSEPSEPNAATGAKNFDISLSDLDAKADSGVKEP